MKKRSVFAVLLTLAVLLALTAPALAEGRPVWPPILSTMSVGGLR